MIETEIMQAIGADLNKCCMELQQLYPEYTRSLIKEEDQKDKSPEEIDEIIKTKPILSASMPYILESLGRNRSLTLRIGKETPDYIARELTERFNNHFKDQK